MSLGLLAAQRRSPIQKQDQQEVAMLTGRNRYTQEKTEISCPACEQQSPFDSGRCAHCFRELGGLAAEAESAVAAAMRKRDMGELRPEVLVPRLGDRLVELGLLGDADLHQALWVQKQRAAAGESILLGKLLVEMGYVSSETLDRAVTEQVLQLQNALKQSNHNLEKRVSERTNQLTDALVKLSEFGQMKADFVANVSHELRTPLTLLTGFLEMVAGQSLGPLNDEQDRALASASRAGKQLGRLIEDLLQFSEATVGAIPLHLEPVSLEIPVRRALDQSWERAKRQAVRLEADLPSRPPKVKADTEKISWVIGEFLGNAIKFTPPGGSVNIATDPQDERVTVTVADSGIGMPEERIEEAFQPFHQLDGSISRHYGGTGLGLALARRIVEGHGSFIVVESQLGQGSRFAFSLPVIC
jgi:signal transduction histidine kinase